MNLRVLELTGPIGQDQGDPVGRAVSICGKLLAGQGAQVLRCEAQAQTRLDAEQAWLHTGKISLAFDYDQATDVACLEQLIAGADVLLDGLGVGRLDALKLSAERLRRDYPQLIVVQVSPFGQTGPYRDYVAEEITLYAMSGLMYSTGDATREPLAAGPALCAYSAGFKAHAATMMALFRRGRDCGGDIIDLSMAETAMDNLEIAIAEKLNLGKTARRNGDEHAIVPWRTYPCKDGEAAIIGGPMRHWLRGAKLFESAALLDGSLHSVVDRIARRGEVAQLMAPWLAQQNKADVYHAGQAAGLAWSHVASVQEALDSPQNSARGYFVSIKQPGLGSCQMPGAPFRASGQVWKTYPAPLTNLENTLPGWPVISATAATENTISKPPLAGIKVLDFSHDWAGPHAARMLADYGAQVIKIEYPKRLDGMRGGYAEKFNQHPRFWQLHRGKQSVTLDLKNKAHLDCCLELSRDADLVIENSRPGVMQALGVGYEQLSEFNPSIIMLSLSAFGADGPESHYAGYGGGIEAISGIQGLTAYHTTEESASKNLGSGASRRIREMDVFNGVAGACAALSALVHRQATGQGQWIDVSERETCTWLIGEHIAAYTATGKQSLPRGNRHEKFAPQGCYRCDGEDRWVVISIKTDAQWQQLAELMDRPDLSQDADLQQASGRQARHDEIDQAISAWTQTQSNLELQHRLQAIGIACARVADTSDLATDEHLAARNWFISLPDATLPGLAFTFARGGAAVKKRGPNLGEHNDVLLGPAGLESNHFSDLTPESLGTAFDNDPELAQAFPS